MDNLLGPALAIVSTILLLVLRELVLSVWKKDRNTYGVSDQQHMDPDLEGEHSLGADSIVEFEEPIPQATQIAVDEFLAELHAKAQEQSTSRIKDGAMTDFERKQSNPIKMAEDSW